VLLRKHGCAEGGIRAVIMAKPLGAVITTAMVMAASAWANGNCLACSTPAPVTIRIDVSRAPVRVEADIGLRELRELAAGRHPGPIVGAYIGTLGYAAEIDNTTREAAPGRFCTTPHYIILHLRLDRTIYIPREFAGDDCLWALAREHEMKHVAAEDEALDQLSSAPESALRAAVGRNPSDPTPSRMKALAGLTIGIQAAIERVLDQMDTERRQLDGAVDTPAELERLEHACEGRALPPGRR
jgi:hypothetical protein